jgi:hypothetical protein
MKDYDAEVQTMLPLYPLSAQVYLIHSLTQYSLNCQIHSFLTTPLSLYPLDNPQIISQDPSKVHT